MGAKPYIWQMVKEAVEQSKNKVVTNKEIKDYIIKKYGDINLSTINCQILVCSVNQQSRTHYPENKKPRVCDSCYDFLYSVARGQVELYDPTKHGQWELYLGNNNKLLVKKTDGELLDLVDNTEQFSAVDEIDNEFVFALESQLRDFIVQNLSFIDSNLQLYVSEDAIDGVEYRTEVGNIDILAQNKKGEFVVIELKLSRGADAVLGQIQRYMGWVKKNMANSSVVHGIIIAKSMSDKLKYAVSVTNNISLFEYTIDFNIKRIEQV